jgi:hypothetical protein
VRLRVPSRKTERVCVRSVASLQGNSELNLGCPLSTKSFEKETEKTSSGENLWEFQQVIEIITLNFAHQLLR